VPFVSVWDTSKTSTGSSTSTRIKLPLESTGTYNFAVDWGDGSTSTITTWNQAETTHTYSTSGIYTLTITGQLYGFRFNNIGDKLKLLSITKFGNRFRLGNSGDYFYGCTNLTTVGGDLDTTGTTSFNSAFLNATSFQGGLGAWDTSNVTDMRSMFQGTSFNQSLSSWNVSKVVNFGSMFFNNTAFNQSLNSWSLSTDPAVSINMTTMFRNASAFNGDITGWNTVRVTNMGAMFLTATSFNQPIGTWDVSNVADMGQMLQSSGFNQNINAWNVSKVTDFSSMFYDTPFNQPLNSWSFSTDPAVSISMSSMFRNATAFNQDITGWNTVRVTNMSLMFLSAPAFNQAIGNWNVSNVTNMSQMFSSATAFNQDIGTWNPSKVTNFTSFMAGKTPATFSSANLNAIYNGWSARSLRPNVTITFGTAKYTAAGSAGRLVLTSSPNSWTITDGGL
jgi:surface protein